MGSHIRPYFYHSLAGWCQTFYLILLYVTCKIELLQGLIEAVCLKHFEHSQQVFNEGKVMEKVKSSGGGWGREDGNSGGRDSLNYL